MLSYLAGGDRASPVAFWGGSLAVTAGVIMHLPMFFMARDMNYHLVGMEMDWTMSAGMVLIVLGTIAAGYGLLPGTPDEARAGVAVQDVRSGPAVPRAGEPDRLTRSHGWLMLTLIFALVIDSMKPASLGFVVPGMIAEYGIPRPTVAILVFFALTGTTIGSLLWGILADRMGRRAAMLLAAVMFIGTAICGAMPTFTMNIVMCFLMGLSAGGMLPITYTLMAELVPARYRGLFLVLLGSVGLTAGYLAASGFAALLEPLFGWRIMWFIGLPTGIILIGLSRFIPESPNFLLMHGRIAEAKAGMARFGMALSVVPAAQSGTRPVVSERPRLIGPGLTGMTLTLNLSAVAWGLVNFGLLLWLPADLRAKGYSIANSDVLLARSALLALPTAVITAWLYTHWSTKRTLMLLFSITAVGLLGLSALGTGFAWLDNHLVVLITLLMIGANGVIAVLLPYAAECYPLRVRGRGTGYVAGSSKAGGIVVQVLTMAAMVPTLGVATIALAMPVVASAFLIGGFGTESRGLRLDTAD